MWYSQQPVPGSCLGPEKRWEFKILLFMDCLMKWLETFAIPDQKADTIARLLVKNIIFRHGIPEELLSDPGANFL